MRSSMQMKNMCIFLELDFEIIKTLHLQRFAIHMISFCLQLLKEFTEFSRCTLWIHPENILHKIRQKQLFCLYSTFGEMISKVL